MSRYNHRDFELVELVCSKKQINIKKSISTNN